MRGLTDVFVIPNQHAAQKHPEKNDEIKRCGNWNIKAKKFFIRGENMEPIGQIIKDFVCQTFNFNNEKTKIEIKYIEDEIFINIEAKKVGD